MITGVGSGRMGCITSVIFLLCVQRLLLMILDIFPMGAVLLSFVRLVFRTAAPVARRPNAPTVIVSIQPKVMNVHA